jgi:hypothetical protein
MKIAALLWFGAVLAASTGLLCCGGDSSGAPGDGGVCSVFAMDGESCMTVGEVCNDNVQSCRCTMGGRRDAGSSWNCDPIGGDGGGFGGRGGTGRDGGGFGGFGGAGGGRRGDGG